MKRIIIFGLVIMIAFAASAQSSFEKYCAVLDFTIGGEASEDDGKYFTNAFRKYFHPKGFVLLDSACIREALTEERILFDSVSSRVDFITMAGNVLGVKYVVQGYVYKNGKEYDVFVKMLSYRISPLDEDKRVLLWADHYDAIERNNKLHIIKKLAKKAMNTMEEDHFLSPVLASPSGNTQNNNGDIVTIYDDAGRWICNGMLIISSDIMAVRISGKKYSLEKSDKTYFRYKTVPKQNNEPSFYVK